MPVLETIAPNIWGLKTPPAEQLRVAAGFHLPCRMTIVRLSDGGLLLHSPIAIHDTALEEIHALGNVAHIVAPNCFHHFFVSKAMQLFPDAKVWCAPGLDRKRKDISFHEVLSDDAPDAWADTMEQHVVQGIPALNEVVFLHKPTQTLIVTDMMFNVHDVTGFLTPLVLGMAGGARKPIQSRLVRFATKDKKAAGQSVQRIFSWDFNRVVMAHGRVIHEDARSHAERAMSVMRAYA